MVDEEELADAHAFTPTRYDEIADGGGIMVSGLHQQQIAFVKQWRDFLRTFNIA